MEMTVQGGGPSHGSRVTIVGCGPGSEVYLTDQARRAVAKAELLVGSRYLLALFQDGPAERWEIDGNIEATLELVAERWLKQKVVVLVGGDPGLFSLARALRRHLGDATCEVIPGISAVQLACARVGIDWHDLRVVSAHGRTPEQDVVEITRAGRVAVLLGHTPLGWLRQLADVAAHSGHRAVLCQDLSWPEERIDEVKVQDLLTMNYSPRSLLLLLREESSP